MVALLVDQRSGESLNFEEKIDLGEAIKILNNLIAESVDEEESNLLAQLRDICSETLDALTITKQ